MRANATNYANTTLATEIGATDLSFSVAIGTGAVFPVVNAATPDYFLVSIETEIVLCKQRAGDTFTVAQRGAEGTTATTHGSGATVVHAITAGELMHLWANLPDSFRVDVPPFARGGSVPLAWDDEFEQGAGNVATAGNWTFAPQDAGQVHSFGQNYTSCFDFHRANTSSGCYYLYQPFSANGAFTITAKLSHAASLSLDNEYQVSLFVANGTNPSTSLDGGYRARVDSLIAASIPSMSTLPWTGSPTPFATPRLHALRGSYDSNSAFGIMSTTWGGSSLAPHQGQQYLSLSYDGAAQWNAWAGDGYTYVHLGYVQNTFTPSSMGFRFYTNHSSAVTYEHVLIDWVRVNLSDRLVYNALLPN